ncbi:hypothetical protein PVAND_014077 [Polypedilum vanderplanki]|uniref:Sushi domain-containing protein n=1 Tax=Polypedilum vanderplanki TaxID=319348 RepID=A0A9J6CTC1_POLVA|nr:hypothetical protein PVAND_014077 [Polypedilum vanderplanki]
MYRTLFLIAFLWLETTYTWNLNFNTHRSEPYESYHRKNSLLPDSNIKYDYSRSQNAIPPITKTQYYYKTHQGRTVSIPSRGAASRIYVGPDENETESYVTKVDETNIGPRKARRPRGDDEYEYEENRFEPKTFFRAGKLCVKCPPEKILIAKRGLDGVQVEIPQLTTCNDRPISRSLYELETLFSKKHHFILPRGQHSFIAQVVNKKNYSVEHVCTLKYKIIVRTCPPFILKNENVKMKCDISNVWGSKCTFSCKNNNGILSHKEPIVCNDNLQWHGTEPDCIFQHREYYKRIENSIQSCQLPKAPEHAKFSCKVDRDLINEIENELFIPDGTVCRVKCARLYEIGENLQKYSAFQCRNGKWNYTQHDDICTKIHLRKL